MGDWKIFMINFENCEKMIFYGVPPYGIPEIQAEHIDERDMMPDDYCSVGYRAEDTHDPR